MDHSGIIEINVQKDVGVSYTLNNFQPVRCSYIGTDPFFFMDMDVDLLEEEELEEFEYFEDLANKRFGNAEKDTDISDRISCLEQKSSDFHRMESFEEDIFNITGAGEEKVSYVPSIETVMTIVNKSRFADDLAKFCHRSGVTISYCEQISGAFYDKDAASGKGKIFLNPYLSLTDKLVLLAGELRRVWQHKKGAGLHPLALEPDKAILVGRLQSADIAVAMVRFGWELQLAGYRPVWDRLEESSLKQLAHSFAREAFLDFRTLNNGEAAAAAFETWFLSDRCRLQDRELIQEMLSDNYAALFQAEGEFATSVLKKMIVALGEVPFGKNYLAQYAGLIVSDPVFSEISDRSNANFLWFIKFEQSFRQKEQELQMLSSPADASASCLLAKTGDSLEREIENGKKEKTPAGHTTVVRFPQAKQSRTEEETNSGLNRQQTSTRHSSGGGERGHTGDSIVYFPPGQ